MPQRKKNDKYVSQAEIDSLNSLMRGVYLKHDVKAGDTIGIDDVFFAMPCQEKQMNSGEFNDGIEVSRIMQLMRHFLRQDILHRQSLQEVLYMMLKVCCMRLELYLEMT